MTKINVASNYWWTKYVPTKEDKIRGFKQLIEWTSHLYAPQINRTMLDAMIYGTGMNKISWTGDKVSYNAVDILDAPKRSRFKQWLRKWLFEEEYTDPKEGIKRIDTEISNHYGNLSDRLNALMEHLKLEQVREPEKIVTRCISNRKRNKRK